VLRIATDVAGDGPTDLQRNVLVSLLENRAINSKQRICIYFLSVLFDRLAHWSGVRRQKEQGEMNVIRSQFKLPAY
jgi:hypothetical protein